MILRGSARLIEHLLHFGEFNVRSSYEQRPGIIRGFQGLLQKEKGLHHARFTRAVRAGENGQRPKFDLLLSMK